MHDVSHLYLIIRKHNALNTAREIKDNLQPVHWNLGVEHSDLEGHTSKGTPFQWQSSLSYKMFTSDVCLAYYIPGRVRESYNRYDREKSLTSNYLRACISRSRAGDVLDEYKKFQPGGSKLVYISLDELTLYQDSMKNAKDDGDLSDMLKLLDTLVKYYKELDINLVLSCSDASYVPRYIWEKVDYLYCYKQTTLQSQQALYQAVFHVKFEEFKHFNVFMNKVIVDDKYVVCDINAGTLQIH